MTNEEKHLVRIGDLKPGDVICSMQYGVRSDGGGNGGNGENGGEDAKLIREELGGVVNHIEINPEWVDLYLIEGKVIRKLKLEQGVLIYSNSHVEHWPRLTHGRESGYR